MGGVPRVVAFDLAESLKDFVHALAESTTLGKSMEDLLTYGMVQRAKNAIDNFEANRPEKGGKDDEGQDNGG